MLYAAVKRINACLNICLAFAGVQLIHKLSVHGKALVKPRLAVLIVAYDGIKPFMCYLMRDVKAQALISLGFDKIGIHLGNAHKSGILHAAGVVRRLDHIERIIRIFAPRIAKCIHSVYGSLERHLALLFIALAAGIIPAVDGYVSGLAAELFKAVSGDYGEIADIVGFECPCSVGALRFAAGGYYHIVLGCAEGHLIASAGRKEALPISKIRYLIPLAVNILGKDRIRLRQADSVFAGEIIAIRRPAQPLKAAGYLRAVINAYARSLAGLERRRQLNIHDGFILLNRKAQSISARVLDLAYAARSVRLIVAYTVFKLKICGGIVAQANFVPCIAARVCKTDNTVFRQMCGKLLIFGIGGCQLCRDAILGLGFGRTVRCCRSRIAAACADAHEHRKN